MNTLQRCVQFYYYVLFIAVIPTVGCDLHSPLPQAPIRPLLDNELVVEAGVGVKTCRIGMPTRELSRRWLESKDVYPELYGDNTALRASLTYPEYGLSVSCEDWTIKAVTCDYSPLDSRALAYKGRTQKGIGSESSYADVFEVYGEPTHISRTETYPEKHVAVRFAYLDQGIYFSYVNDTMNYISAFEPSLPPYEELDRKDIGDVRELREMARRITNQKSMRDTD